MFGWLVTEPWKARATLGKPSELLASPLANQLRPCFALGTERALQALEQVLAGLDDRGRTTVVWLLIELALDRMQAEDAPAATGAVELAEKIVGSLRGDGLAGGVLAAHLEFIRACIHQAETHRTEAQRALAKAISGYQREGAQRQLEGVCYAGLALLALEAADLDGERVGWPGAREQMDRAIVALREGCDPGLADYYRQVLHRLEAQWAFLDRVLAAEDTGAHFDREPAMVDAALYSLLEWRCRYLAVSDAPVETVFAAADAHERVARRLGTESNFLEEVIGWYGHRQAHEKVEWLLRRLLEVTPADPHARRRLSVTLFHQARWPELIELLRQLLEEFPDDAESHMTMAIALREIGQLRAAYYHLTRVAELDPEQDMAAAVAREILPAVAFCLVDGELQVIPGAEALSPQEMQAGIFAAMLASEPDQLEARIEKMLENDPETGRLALRYLEMQGIIDLPEASPALEHLERAEEYFGTARMEDAAREYRAAIVLDPQLSQAYMGLGDVHYREGAYFVARACFEESVAVEPNPLAYRFMGDSLRQIGKASEAIPCYRSALALQPDYQGARMSLQELLASGVQPPEPEAANADDPEPEFAAGFNPPSGSGERPRPTGADGLVAAMAEKMPYLPDVMAAHTTEERMRIIRRALEPARFAALAMALQAVAFHLGSKERRSDEALAVTELRLALARELPPEWVPDAKRLGRWRLESDALLALAQFAERRGDSAGALALLEQAEARLDRDEREREYQGLDAFSEFDRLFIRRHPRAILCENLARLHHRQGNEARRDDYAARAEELDRRHPTTEVQLDHLFHLADATLEQDQYDEALRFYDQALDLAQSDPARRISNHHVARCYQGLAEAYTKLGLHRRALELVAKAIALNRAQGHQGRLQENYALVATLHSTRPDLFESGRTGGTEEEDP